MKIDEKLSEVFMTDPMKNSDFEIIDAEPVGIIKEDKKVDYDYDSIRSNLYSILNQGQEALLHALEVAKQSEHPRAFEVVGNLMKNLSDINHQIIDLHTKRHALTKNEPKESSKTVTNNSIFVGSTSELSKMIENLKREK